MADLITVSLREVKPQEEQDCIFEVVAKVLPAVICLRTLRSLHANNACVYEIFFEQQHLCHCALAF